MKNTTLAIAEVFSRPCPHSRRAPKSRVALTQAQLSVIGGQRAMRASIERRDTYPSSPTAQVPLRCLAPNSRRRARGFVQLDV